MKKGKASQGQTMNFAFRHQTNDLASLHNLALNSFYTFRAATELPFFKARAEYTLTHVSDSVTLSSSMRCFVYVI